MQDMHVSEFVSVPKFGASIQPPIARTRGVSTSTVEADDRQVQGGFGGGKRHGSSDEDDGDGEDEPAEGAILDFEDDTSVD